MSTLYLYSDYQKLNHCFFPSPYIPSQYIAHCTPFHPLPTLPSSSCTPSPLLSVPADLSPEERSELEEIRRRKGALLQEIQRLQEELREAIIEVEGLEASTEGRSDIHTVLFLPT